jgi:hypothetical protein
MTRLISSKQLLQLAIIGALAQVRAYPQADANATAATQGSLCVMAVTPPNSGEKSLANPAGGNLVKQYAVKVDKSPPIPGLPGQGVPVPPLLLGESHVVRVFGDGKQVESFRFRFEDYSTNELCLVFDEFYATWKLLNCEDAGTWGACRPPHRLPWVDVKSCEVVDKRIVPVRRDPQTSAVEYYVDYQIRYVAEGRVFVKYSGSGLPPSMQQPSAESLKAVPRDCRYSIRYHPGMPEKAEVSPRQK